MMNRTIIPAILVAFFICVSTPSSAIAAAVLADLENALMCKCDDKCGKVLINCSCSTSDETRAKFVKMLDSGLTVDQIIQQQVDKYGETVLSAPTKKGFNLTAWVTPFVVLLAGGFGIRKVIDAWTKKNRPESENQKTEDQETPIPSKYSRRLQDELDRLEL